MLKVNEIFYSIQGESSFAGRPCLFVRLTGCNLRCTYCDTRYAYDRGDDMPLHAILREVDRRDCPLVEVTGGEPLLQRESGELVKALLDGGRTVLVETNGTLDIGAVDERALRIVDVKCPGSGMADHALLDNLDNLTPRDEVKFVLSHRRDYEWACEIASRFSLFGRVTVLFSPLHGVLGPGRLAEWMLADRVDGRLQIQLHKVITESGGPDGTEVR